MGGSSPVVPQSIHTLSMIFWKWTSTEQLWMSICWSELWISTESFLDLIFCARYPNTKSIESMTLDFPLPFGPIMHENRCMIERKKLYSKGNRSWPVYITHFVCEQFKNKIIHNTRSCRLFDSLGFTAEGKAGQLT